MVIKHLSSTPSVYDRLYTSIDEMLDLYYQERLELAELVVLYNVFNNMNLEEYEKDSISFKYFKLLHDISIEQIKNNNSECAILDKMLRYIKLMESNDKTTEIERYKYRFYSIIQQLLASYKKRIGYFDLMSKVAVRGILNNTTNIKIISNMDISKPLIDDERINDILEHIPSK